MSQAENCIFCKIARAEAPAVKIFEDEHTFAFMDIYPASDGHALVISKAHYKNLFDMDPALLTAVSLTTQKVGWAILRAMNPDGLRVMQFNGASAGQTVFHYHVHLRPTYSGQDIRSHGRALPDRDHIKDLATKIRAELGN